MIYVTKLIEKFPQTNKTRQPSVGLSLDHHPRRWPTINQQWGNVSRLLDSLLRPQELLPIIGLVDQMIVVNNTGGGRLLINPQ